MSYGKSWFVKMVMASSYVIKDISRSIEDALDTENFRKSRDILEKFSSRYVEDTDLQVIYHDFQDYVVTRDKKRLRKLMAKLKKLIASRRVEASSTFTGSLWYTCKRPGSSTVLRTV